MTDLAVFRDLSSTDGRLSFHTQETAQWIPESPGCYAWFLPLWLYSDDLRNLKRILRTVHTWDDRVEAITDAEFTWDQVTLRVGRRPRILDEDKFRRIWERVLAMPDGKEALQRLLLESSPLLPPLYIGRTQNLRQRYRQHVKGGGDGMNDFHTRFERCVRSIEGPETSFDIGISDLLFACIETSTGVRDTLQRLVPDHTGRKDLNALIEHLLMEPCRPPFSLR